MFRWLVPLLVVVTALVGLIAWSQRRPEPARISGFVEADEIRVGSRIGGRVARVQAAEGQRVRLGDPLFELEPFDLLDQEREAAAVLAAREAEYRRMVEGLRDEEVAQARARVERLEAKLQLLENGPRPQEIEAGRAQVTVAESHLKLAQQNFHRAAQLLEKGATTREDLERLTEELQAAQALLVVRQQELELLETGTRSEEIAQARAELAEARWASQLAEQGFRREEIDAAEAARDAAAAALDAVRTRKLELRVAAPVDGVVEALELQPGDLVGAGQPAMSLIDDRRLWVRAYLPENRLDVQVGDRLAVTVDSYPGATFFGAVSFVAREAEFTPANVQTPEERSKQVFRVKVTLEANDQLRPGMAADVWLDGALP